MINNGECSTIPIVRTTTNDSHSQNIIHCYTSMSSKSLSLIRWHLGVESTIRGGGGLLLDRGAYLQNDTRWEGGAY